MTGVFGPFKCPDCGTWWAGFEHRCREPEESTSTTRITADPMSVTIGPVWCAECMGYHAPPAHEPDTEVGP